MGRFTDPDKPVPPTDDEAAEGEPEEGLPEVGGDGPAGLPLAGRHVWFAGRLGGLTRRAALALVRQQGGVPHDHCDPQVVDLVVIGAEELPLGEQEELLSEEARRAAAEGRLEIISETVLWQRLGMVENEQHVRRLYTPAMLAHLLKVPVATIRRWHRRGLIVPVREVHRLPYFDFQEVATARRLAELVAAGASPAAIERKLAELARYVPDVERPLAQLSVIVEGRQILLRQGAGLVEPGGQRRIDFEALEHPSPTDSVAEPSALPAASVLEFPQPADEPMSVDELLRWAAQAEDDEQLEMACELTRAALAAGGPRPDLCFQLAELLYRQGDLGGARERYFMAIELDEDYVEARANLGCLLVEQGQPELAVAAFTGALRHHHDYPDAHYHLARTLDELGRRDEADEHWQAFLDLAPGSPWAVEARRRLGREPDGEAPDA
ncbi:MAG: tetratricopeptide repeat protein [Pirellulales bacterium]